MQANDLLVTGSARIINNLSAGTFKTNYITLSDNNLEIGTAATNATATYADKTNPRITFHNAANNQSGSLVFSDYDTIGTGISVSLVSDQSDAYIIAPHIKAGTGFVGDGANITALNASNVSSGTLSADRLATSGVTAGSYGPTANVSGSNGTTINVPQITVDNKGRVTSVANRVYTSVDNNTTYTSLKNPNALTISLNGTSQGAYDGSAAKSIDITPSSIGAAASSHTHNYAGSSSAGGAATNSDKVDGYHVVCSTTAPPDTSTANTIYIQYE